MKIYLLDKIKNNIKYKKCGMIIQKLKKKGKIF